MRSDVHEHQDLQGEQTTYNTCDAVRHVAFGFPTKIVLRDHFLINMGHNSSRLGEQGTWKRSRECTPRELYNAQQDTWALFVVISLREDAGNKVDLSLSLEEASI
ncbi:hypothetical protein CYMTET_13987 [Cymbomonas tetramitiformis]|uniref:Uncharacterized protein n=1 Tax=Cymbomonas tetramitiformis TaxID=36881 RepID=A0AAE0LAU3_9CHLO|nr:hypothetical protein CYMTET_13987 [Cymbomonas tetramitiformis]